MQMVEKTMNNMGTEQPGILSGALPNMRRRLGSTVYEVHLHFNPDAKETMNKKMLRIVKNDLNSPAAHATMAVPQTDWLPERSTAA